MVRCEQPRAQSWEIGLNGVLGCELHELQYPLLPRNWPWSPLCGVNAKLSAPCGTLETARALSTAQEAGRQRTPTVPSPRKLQAQPGPHLTLLADSPFLPRALPEEPHNAVNAHLEFNVTCVLHKITVP